MTSLRLASNVFRASVVRAQPQTAQTRTLHQSPAAMSEFYNLSAEIPGVRDGQIYACDTSA